MVDTRVHNDCDGGDCAACNWDAAQEVARKRELQRAADIEILRGHGLDRIAEELVHLRNLERQFLELSAMIGAAT